MRKTIIEVFRRNKGYVEAKFTGRWEIQTDVSSHSKGRAYHILFLEVELEESFLWKKWRVKEFINEGDIKLTHCHGIEEC